MASGNSTPSRFEVGDNVLCFEPDPTKARILYDSKVTNIEFIKDESGKKAPHYRIHFKGWSHSWDRWVSETNILEYNQENVRLQTELQKKITRKKNGRSKQSHDKERRNESIRISDDDSESVKSPSLPESNSLFNYADIELNPRLKLELENDCIRVKRKNLLVKLPKTPNVLDILKSYYEHAKTSLTQGDKNGHNILQEILEGIRIYFDFTLPTLLLYNCEQIQYKQIQSIMTGSNVIVPSFKNGSVQSHSHSSPSYDEEEMSTFLSLASAKIANKYDLTLLPCQVYGVEHLLRLFVKLPQLLSKNEITNVKVSILAYYLTDFFNYLSTRDDLFSEENYEQRITNCFVEALP